ncbi:DUF2897 family protein [Shewanella schlegeliana]|uniref:DUF2897 family protein n=1 Tax=Shewanella schlegeliana TaxID=190308 RepID=A0ABS1SZN5_9GAMM|nr:DUF2897 family protein [Shewanella schlegeliana]MBL4913795.1 DUF2897 family protein [Shewanella schlegeliana]MCL1108820.1 DUF2897 family protein [Shewanella schlegeliana]GIU25895.1 hypothetical protein TUM4433_11080 [Shewanella schlegeliana]
MSDLEVGLLILLVLGVIASNLAVLKYSAKHKMTQFGKNHHDKKLSEKEGSEQEESVQSRDTTTSNDTPTNNHSGQSDKTGKS